MSLRFPGTFSWGGACNGQMPFLVGFPQLGWFSSDFGRDGLGAGWETDAVVVNDAGWGVGYRGSAEDHCFIPGCEVPFGALRAPLPGWERLFGHQ